MNVIPADQSIPATATNGATPLGFWRRLAQAVDEYVADRSARAVPVTTLRRSRRDTARFRRLMKAPTSSAVGGMRGVP
jgi:hypothetical protein